ncbi:MAG: hypothetical protein WBL62_06730 [Gallionella sp.]
MAFTPPTFKAGIAFISAPNGDVFQVLNKAGDDWDEVATLAQAKDFASNAPLTLTAVAQAAADLLTAKAVATANAHAFHSQMMASLTGNPTEYERETWTTQLNAALAVTAKTALAADGVAFLTGAGLYAAAPTAVQAAALSAWAANVIAKASKYALLSGMANTLRANALTAITAASTLAALGVAVSNSRNTANAAIAALPKV